MGWLSKVWAALVALFPRLCKLPAISPGRLVAEMPVAAVVPVVEAPAETPVPPAGQLQPLDTANLSHNDQPDFYSGGSPIAQLIEQLERAFPVPAIRPASTMNELQYAAGQRAVVDWVRMKQKRGQA